MITVVKLFVLVKTISKYIIQFILLGTIISVMMDNKELNNNNIISKFSYDKQHYYNSSNITVNNVTKLEQHHIEQLSDNENYLIDAIVNAFKNN